MDYTKARKDTKLVFDIGQLREKHTIDMPEKVEMWVQILGELDGLNIP